MVFHLLRRLLLSMMNLLGGCCRCGICRLRILRKKTYPFICKLLLSDVTITALGEIKRRFRACRRMDDYFRNFRGLLLHPLLLLELLLPLSLLLQLQLFLLLLLLSLALQRLLLQLLLLLMLQRLLPLQLLLLLLAQQVLLLLLLLQLFLLLLPLQLLLLLLLELLLLLLLLLLQLLLLLLLQLQLSLTLLLRRLQLLPQLPRQFVSSASLLLHFPSYPVSLGAAVIIFSHSLPDGGRARRPTPPGMSCRRISPSQRFGVVQLAD